MLEHDMAKQYIPDSQVARDRYHVHPTTINRWDRNQALNFPKPIRINNRKYRDREELDEWDRSRRSTHSNEAA
jgi:hypothetical protein